MQNALLAPEITSGEFFRRSNRPGRKTPSLKRRKFKKKLHCLEIY